MKPGADACWRVIAGLEHVASVGGLHPFGIGEKNVTLRGITELLPGEEVQVSADVDGAAAAVIDSTSVRVEPSGAPDVGELKDATAGDTTFVPPLFLLGLLLVLLFGLLAFRAYRRRATATAAPAIDHLPARELVRQHS